MTFTIVYLDARRMPKVTYKEEYQANSADLALYEFVNERKHDGHFVAAIIQGPASIVTHTL
jgi:hypothetical protein